jgi:hypothetical protein
MTTIDPDWLHSSIWLLSFSIVVQIGMIVAMAVDILQVIARRKKHAEEARLRVRVISATTYHRAQTRNIKR